MPHSEDRKGQLGLGVERVVAVVVVALLEEGMVRGLIRARAAQPFAGAVLPLGLSFLPAPKPQTRSKRGALGAKLLFQKSRPYLLLYKERGLCSMDNFLFLFFRAAPKAYGGSQARG